MRIISGELQDWNLHFNRLLKGVEFVYGPFTDEEDWSLKLKNRIEAKFQDVTGDRILRLTVFREQARGILRTGLNSITDLALHTSYSPLDPKRYFEKNIKLRTCPALERPYWWPSYLKAGNYFDTIIRQKMFMKPGDDDLLFLSGSDTVLESSVANIFVVRHDRLYTAPLGPNVLAGVMRQKVLDAAQEYFIDFNETETSIEQLFKADAVFGSNSVRGLFLIDRIDDHEINCSEDFLLKFNSLKSRVFR
jgi:branched-subunit amino acid aminotransferase/4-amino-4-deoxychorismate lyase